jgi:hypothetical protein
MVLLIRCSAEKSPGKWKAFCGVDAAGEAAQCRVEYRGGNALIGGELETLACVTEILYDSFPFGHAPTQDQLVRGNPHFCRRLTTFALDIS